MRILLKHKVRTAAEVSLVDLAVQALDGTKVAANAAGYQIYDMAKLERLLAMGFCSKLAKEQDPHVHNLAQCLRKSSQFFVILSSAQR